MFMCQQDFPGGLVAEICTPNARGPGSNPGQGKRSHVLQLRVHMPQGRWKILCVTTKTWQNQIKYCFLNP